MTFSATTTRTRWMEACTFSMPLYIARSPFVPRRWIDLTTRYRLAPLRRHHWRRCAPAGPDQGGVCRLVSSWANGAWATEDVSRIVKVVCTPGTGRLDTGVIELAHLPVSRFA